MMDIPLRIEPEIYEALKRKIKSRRPADVIVEAASMLRILVQNEFEGRKESGADLVALMHAVLVTGLSSATGNPLVDAHTILTLMDACSLKLKDILDKTAKEWPEMSPLLMRMIRELRDSIRASNQASTPSSTQGKGEAK